MSEPPTTSVPAPAPAPAEPRHADAPAAVPEPMPRGNPLRKRRRWGRWVLLIVVLVLVLTQSGVLKYAVLPRLRSMLSCDASSGRVFVRINGSLVINDLQLRVRGVPGEAGRFFRAPRAVVRPDWGALLVGSARVDSLRIDGATVRVSQGADRSLNVMGLSFGGGMGPGGSLPTHLPEIELRDALLQFGENDGADYAPLVTMRVEGTLTAQSDAPGVYAIDLAEVRPTPGAGAGLRLQGSLDTSNDTGRIALKNVDLSDWSERTAPEQAREIWRQIHLRGAISAASFSYGPDQGVVTEFELEGVDLNIPVPADTGAAPDAPAGATPEPALLAMRGVSGRLRFRPDGLGAELQGWIEDLPCAVTLTTAGYSRSAALECVIDTRDFELGEKSGLLPFAPDAVHEMLRRFSSPTARISANIRVTRDAPGADGTPGEVRSMGSVTLSNGRLRYEKFPYPVEQVRGLIEFTSHHISLVGISGVGPSGARFIASGGVEPDMDGPAMDLSIDGFGIPFDEHLLATLHEIGHDEVERVFSKPAYERLVAEGLVRTPAQATQEREALERLAGAATQEDLLEVERLTARQAVPVLQLGAPVDVRVHVTRSSGPEPSVKADIRVEMQADGAAGLVCEAFPFPAVLDAPLTIHIGDEHLRVESARLAAVSGGRATLDIDVRHGDGPPRDLMESPEVRIRAGEVLVGPLLLHAVREAVERGRTGSARGGDTGDFDPAGLMEALNIEGTVSSDARLLLGHDNTSHHAQITLDGLSARPEGAQVLQDVRGSIVLTNDRASARGVTARIGSGTVRLDASASLAHGGVDMQTLDGTIRAESFPLQAPIAPIAALISAHWGEQIDKLTREHRPSGQADGVLTFDGSGIGGLLVTGADRLAFDALGGRVRIDDLQGSVEVTPGGLAFRDFGAGVEFDDEPLARVRVEGDGAAVRLHADDLNLGSGALRSLIAQGMGERTPLLAWLSESALTGRASAEVDLEQRDGVVRMTRGLLRPQRLAMTMRGREVSFGRVEGEIGWDGRRAEVRGVTLHADDWEARVDGHLEPGESAAAGTEGLGGVRRGSMRASLESHGLPDSLRAMLPKRVGGVIDALSITCEGVARVRDASWSRDEAGDTLDATVEFTDAGFQTGVAAQEVAGKASVRVRPASAAHPGGALEVDVDADTLRLAGVRMNSARLEVRGDADGARLSIPVIRASVHGGVMTGRAAVGGGGKAGQEGGQRFEFSGELAGVRFSDVLADLGAGDDASRAVNRGTLEANLSLTGAMDGDEGGAGGRRGRGLVRVQGGDLLAMPGVVKLLEITNLQAPRGEVMDFGVADFFVQGDRMVISELSIMSPSIVVHGQGEIAWPELSVRMQFRSQARNRVAILSDILEGLRDEFVTTVARGTLYDPRLEFDQLSATRRFLETVFGGRGSRSDKDRSRPTP